MKKKKRVRLSLRKLFCFASFIFLLICTLWYGGRAAYFYLSSKKTEVKETSLTQFILKDNQKSNTFKKFNNEYYFYNNVENNYLLFNNIIWRIVKINSDNEIVLISEEPLTSLANGNNDYILKWLNTIEKEDNTGILQNNITNVESYLTTTKQCEDNVDDLKQITCKKTNNDYYFSLLDINDYIKTGAKTSFINNKYYNYLINKNNGEIWYMNDEGELDTTDGTEIMGIKPVITIKKDISYKSGSGTKDSPYIIEDKNPLFASYVKLGEDTYRVYEEKEEVLKLSLNDYLTINNEKVEHKYSNNNYFHNDTKYNTLAYYLNNTYLNTLSYNSKIVTNYYGNYFYGDDNDYNYKEVLNKKVDTKIYMLSIGDVILNNLNNYFLATGTNDNNKLVYIKESDGTVTKESVDTEKNIIPCISINKNILTTGAGTISDPYRTE